MIEQKNQASESVLRDCISRTVADSIAVKQAFIDTHGAAIEKISFRLAGILGAGGKLLLFGNGGSAADAQHIAAEFVNRFRAERPPLAALALTTDTSILTSIGNDYGYDDIFRKQIQALGRREDAAVGISTSGNSPNVVTALQEARDRGILTIGWCGQSGGKMAPLCDHLFCVPSRITARIQESHILLGHLFCDLVDRILYPGESAAADREGK